MVIFTEDEEKELTICLEVDSSTAIYDRLRKLFTTNGWVEESQLVDVLEKPLMRLCAYYLVVEKRRGYALDTVGKHNFYFEISSSYAVKCFLCYGCETSTIVVSILLSASEVL